MRVIERDSCRVAVTAYVDPLLYYEWPQALERSPDSLLVTDPAEALRPILAKARAEGLPLIVLAHADQVSVAELLRDLPRPAVIVVGHDPQESLSATRWEDAIWVDPEPPLAWHRPTHLPLSRAGNRPSWKRSDSSI